MARLKIALFFFLLFSFQSLHAFSGALLHEHKLRVAKSAHFDLIYSDETALSAATLFEKMDAIYDELKAKYKMSFDIHFPVVLTASVDTHNAYYSCAPFSHIVIYDSSAEVGEVTHSEVIINTFRHELIHAITYNLHNGFWWGVERGFGDTFNSALWTFTTGVSEGATVSGESEEGEGRLNSDFHTQLTKQAVIEGLFPLYSEIQGTRAARPGGYLSYYFGGAFSKYLQDTYGWDLYAKLLYRLANWQSLTYFTCFREVYGFGIKKAWDAWKASIKNSTPAVAKDPAEQNFISAQVFTPTLKIGGEKRRSIEALASTKDGTIFYWDKTKTEIRKVSLLPKKSLEKPRLRSKLFCVQSAVTRICASEDGKFLAISYTSANSTVPTTRVKVVNTKTHRALILKQKHLRDGTIFFSKGNYYIAAVETKASQSALCVFRFEKNRATLLAKIPFSPEHFVFNPVGGEDGTIWFLHCHKLKNFLARLNIFSNAFLETTKESDKNFGNTDSKTANARGNKSLGNKNAFTKNNGETDEPAFFQIEGTASNKTLTQSKEKASNIESEGGNQSLISEAPFPLIITAVKDLSIISGTSRTRGAGGEWDARSENDIGAGGEWDENSENGAKDADDTKVAKSKAGASGEGDARDISGINSTGGEEGASNTRGARGTGDIRDIGDIKDIRGASGISDIEGINGANGARGVTFTFSYTQKGSLVRLGAAKINGDSGEVSFFLSSVDSSGGFYNPVKVAGGKVAFIAQLFESSKLLILDEAKFETAQSNKMLTESKTFSPLGEDALFTPAQKEVAQEKIAALAENSTAFNSARFIFTHKGTWFPIAAAISYAIDEDKAFKGLSSAITPNTWLPLGAFYATSTPWTSPVMALTGGWSPWTNSGAFGALMSNKLYKLTNFALYSLYGTVEVDGEGFKQTQSNIALSLSANIGGGANITLGETFNLFYGRQNKTTIFGTNWGLGALKRYYPLRAIKRTALFSDTYFTLGNVKKAGSLMQDIEGVELTAHFFEALYREGEEEPLTDYQNVGLDLTGAFVLGAPFVLTASIFPNPIQFLSLGGRVTLWQWSIERSINVVPFFSTNAVRLELQYTGAFRHRHFDERVVKIGNTLYIARRETTNDAWAIGHLGDYIKYLGNGDFEYEDLLALTAAWTLTPNFGGFANNAFQFDISVSAGVRLNTTAANPFVLTICGKVVI